MRQPYQPFGCAAFRRSITNSLKVRFSRPRKSSAPWLALVSYLKKARARISACLAWCWSSRSRVKCRPSLVCGYAPSYGNSASRRPSGLSSPRSKPFRRLQRS